MRCPRPWRRKRITLDDAVRLVRINDEIIALMAEAAAIRERHDSDSCDPWNWDDDDSPDA